MLGATLTFGFENRNTFLTAIGMYEGSAAGFAHCLIAANNSAAGCDFTATFDRAMRPVAGIKVL